MTRYFDDNLLREIESRIDIVELASETVLLTRKGNRYWGLCPFHEEKTPSFSVTPGKNLFYCFGCHAGGNIYTFLSKRDGLDFKEAVEVLANRAGVQLTTAQPSKEQLRRKQLLKINMVAAEFYHDVLSSEKALPAMDYLKKRGLKASIQQKFKIGYAPEHWTVLEEYLQKAGFSSQLIKESGLIKRSSTNRYYDLFRNRIIFPIYNYHGEIIGFGGRALDEGMPKYLNTPETEIYQKRKNLYGLFQAREAIRHNNEVILVEGYMDCIKLHQYGINNVVASLGTALTREQAFLLRRYAEKILIIYDGDEAGQREAFRAIDILKETGLKIEVLILPEGRDPDEFIELYGKEEFLRNIKNNKYSYIEFKLKRHIDAVDVLNLEAKIRIINALKNDIKSCNSEIEKDYYIKTLAGKLEIEENLVYREIFRPEASKRGIAKNKTYIKRDNIQYGNYSIEEKILAAMLKNQAVFQMVKDNIGLEFFSSREINQLIRLFDELEGSAENRWEQMQKMVSTEKMEAALAKTIFMIEDHKEADFIEIQSFLRKIKAQEGKKRWQSIYKDLSALQSENNFHSVLAFILYLDKFLNHAREGGIT